MPVLLATQQVPRAPKLQVQCRDPESGTQLGELSNGRKPAPGDGRQCFIRRNKEIGVSTPVRSTDTSAELIQLGKTVSISPIDDQRVRHRDVQPVLDDGRR